MRADVEAAIASASVQSAVAENLPFAASVSLPAGGASEIVKLSTMRKVIAQRMIESKTQVPHFYLTMDCELDELLKVRKSLNEAQEDVKISVNDSLSGPVRWH